MTRSRKYFLAALAVFGSLASILGFFKIDASGLTEPLSMEVSVPFWLIITLFCAAILIAGYQSSRIQRRSEGEIQSIQTENEELKAQNSELISQKEQAVRNNNAVEQLREYERLENQIVALLKSGKEQDLSGLVRETSASGANAQQQVLSAISSLGDKIEGTGGITNRYRLKSDKA